jgi:hypothetical protein
LLLGRVIDWENILDKHRRVNSNWNKDYFALETLKEMNIFLMPLTISRLRLAGNIRCTMAAYYDFYWSRLHASKLSRPTCWCWLIARCTFVIVDIFLFFAYLLPAAANLAVGIRDWLCYASTKNINRAIYTDS